MSFLAKLTGKELIRRRLESARGEWVSAWDLAQLCIEYKRPIWQLRHQDGLNIENRTERVHGKVHGYYRLMPAPEKVSASRPLTDSSSRKENQPALLTIPQQSWADPGDAA